MGGGGGVWGGGGASCHQPDDYKRGTGYSRRKGRVGPRAS